LSLTERALRRGRESVLWTGRCAAPSRLTIQ
jgi:hypothetical protein